MNPAPPPEDFVMGKAGEDYVGRCKCPHCGKHAEVRAKVVAGVGGKKFFAGSSKLPAVKPKGKTLQIDAYEAFNEMPGLKDVKGL
jgi:hypothetical protein